MGLFRGAESGGFASIELSDQIMMNLKFWLDWSLLHVGAFDKYDVPASGAAHDIDGSTLTYMMDEYFNEGRVWCGPGGGWVFESGVAVSDPPEAVSGVYVDNVWLPIGTSGIHGYHVDYLAGRVIFDYPHPTGTTVSVPHSRRRVYVASADNPDFMRLLERTLEAPVESTILSRQAVMPAIFIDDRTGVQRGLMLGGGQTKTRTILFHIFANTPSDRNLLRDWVDKQTRQCFVGVDFNAIGELFDTYGDVSIGGNYDSWRQEFPWRKLRFVNGRSSKIDSVNPTIFRGRVDVDIEVDIGAI